MTETIPAKKEVAILNPTQTPRETVVTTVIPLTESEALPTKHGSLISRDEFEAALNLRPFCQVEPFGPFHPGTTKPRFARVRFPYTLGSGTSDRLDLVEWSNRLADRMKTDQAPSFLFHRNLDTPTLLGLRMSLHIPWAGVDLLGKLKPVERWSGPLVKTWRSRARIPKSPIWAELLVEAYNELPYVRFWLWYGYSDPSVRDRFHNVNHVELHVGGCDSRVHFASQTLTGATGYGEDQTRIYVVDDPAHEGEVIGAGQSHLVTGVLLFGGPGTSSTDAGTLAAEAELPVLSMADWREYSGPGYGPHGIIPKGPGKLGNPISLSHYVSEQAIREWHGKPRSPWDESAHCSYKDPSSAGLQPGFGLTVLGMDARSMNPIRLWGVMRSVYQEARRPMFHRDRDGRPIREKDHGDCILEMGAPHPHSKDTLGQDPNGKQYRREGFKGYDLEHYTQQPQLELALLTGDPGTWMLTDSTADVWLMSWIRNNRGTTHQNTRVSRSIGRNEKTGAWHYLITGRADVLERVVEKAQQYESDPVMKPRGPDKRHLGGRVKYLPPWEMAIEAEGLVEAAMVAGVPPTARTVKLLRWVCLSGFVKEDGHWGTPYSLAADLSEHDGISNGLTKWALPAIAIGLYLARATEDVAWIARATEILEQWAPGVHVEEWDELHSYQIFDVLDPV